MSVVAIENHLATNRISSSYDVEDSFIDLLFSSEEINFKISKLKMKRDDSCYSVRVVQLEQSTRVDWNKDKSVETKRRRGRRNLNWPPPFRTFRAT